MGLKASKIFPQKCSLLLLEFLHEAAPIPSASFELRASTAVDEVSCGAPCGEYPRSQSSEGRRKAPPGPGLQKMVHQAANLRDLAGKSWVSPATRCEPCFCRLRAGSGGESLPFLHSSCRPERRRRTVAPIPLFDSEILRPFPERLRWFRTNVTGSFRDYVCCESRKTLADDRLCGIGMPH